MPGLPNDVKFLMLLAVKIAPLCQTVIVYLLIITSVICLILCMIGTVLVINQERERKERELGESVDFRLPLENGQYTAIRILPSALRKISSKTSLFSWWHFKIQNDEINVAQKGITSSFKFIDFNLSFISIWLILYNVYVVSKNQQRLLFYFQNKNYIISKRKVFFLIL